MREKPSRKCNRFVNLTNFDFVIMSDRPDFRPTQDVLQLNHHVKLRLIHPMENGPNNRSMKVGMGICSPFCFNPLPGSVEGEKPTDGERNCKVVWSVGYEVGAKAQISRMGSTAPEGNFVPDLPSCQEIQTGPSGCGDK